MNPSFDFAAAQAAMQAAAKAATGAAWPALRPAFARGLAGAGPSLQRLAAAHSAGELDEDALQAALRSEQRALAALLVPAAPGEPALLLGAAQAALQSLQRTLAAEAAAAAPPAARTARATAARRAQATPAGERRLNVRPDTVDFRDLMYTPTLVEVGTTMALASYRKLGVPILDQGREGACTGFGLATVVHYLLRRRQVIPDSAAISPRMLYAMARRYDEWPGEAYEGASCRGAMKGWHKHGVCRESLWRHDPQRPDATLTSQRSADAQARPLGAYFRVNHKDLVALHTAISEVGILYASASVHSGWQDVGKDGLIALREGSIGGHAFAIVAYDRAGLWIQNSWGKDWGHHGFARIGYDDWLKNGSDVWVARLGVPIEPLARTAAVGAGFTASSRAKAYALDEVRPHIVSLGNDGALRSNGNLGTTAEGVRRLLHDDFPRLTAGWPRRRLVLYAHGGLVGEDAAVQRVAEYRAQMLPHQCYPLAVVWHSDYWSTLKNMLEDALRHRRTEGLLDKARDFLLDRLDDALEPLARKLSGKAAWDEMKENALAATQSAAGGARRVADEIAARIAADPQVELHLVGHSAGAVLLAPLVQRLTAAPADGGLSLRVASCTLWAPACTMALFDSLYLPALQDGRIGRLALYTLTDAAEQADHCARIYNKSLLYLVSNAFEAHPRIPLLRPEGVPLLGMARFVQAHRGLQALVAAGRVSWVLSPNTTPVGQAGGAGSSVHGGFDDDKATVASTLAFIRGDGSAAARVGREVARDYAPMAGASRLQRLRAQLAS